jgi:uroporphyrinogen-III synthase
MTSALAGRAVLVTRPEGLAERLASLLRAEGGEAVLFPTIEILPPEDPAGLVEVIGRLQAFDIAIFISPTAVAKADAAVRASRAWPPPPPLRYAAVGGGTAQALRAAGFTDIIAPQGRGDSEALAALPELAQVRGKRIVIFRGQGGRETLREILEARGAEVAYAECYRRAVPRAEVAPLIDRWQRGGVHAVSITSAEGLKNLLALLGPAGAPLLCATPVFVPHPRVGKAARALGIERVTVTGTSDEALVEAIAAFFAKV